MTSRNHLRAAARCWERAGFYEDAAERFTRAESWRDAGRCFSQAQRHHDAALAYSRAEEPLLEARQHLMSSWPERTRSLYERLRLGSSLSPREEVEVLLSLGEVEAAQHVALGSGGREAVATLARLGATRGRPDLAGPFWSHTDATSWESFTPWNRSLRCQLPPPVVEAAKIWPSVEFSEVSLVPVWESPIEWPMQGDHALAWSDDSNCFAGVLDRQGLLFAEFRPEGIIHSILEISSKLRCARFLPNSHSLLVGSYREPVRLVLDDGTSSDLIFPWAPGHVSNFSFSPQGDRIVLAGTLGEERGAKFAIYRWCVNHPSEELISREQPLGFCRARAAWSPDGELLAWSANSWENPTCFSILGPEGELQVHNDTGGFIEGLNFTPDGRFLVSASSNQTLAVRDGHTGERISEIEEYQSWVNGVTIHSLAALLAVGEGNNIHFHRLCGQPPWLSKISRLEGSEQVWSLAFSPNGDYLLVMTGAGRGEKETGHLHLYRVDLKP